MQTHSWVLRLPALKCDSSANTGVVRVKWKAFYQPVSFHPSVWSVLETFLNTWKSFQEPNSRIYVIIQGHLKHSRRTEDLLTDTNKASRDLFASLIKTWLNFSSDKGGVCFQETQEGLYYHVNQSFSTAAIFTIHCVTHALIKVEPWNSHCPRAADALLSARRSADAAHLYLQLDKSWPRCGDFYSFSRTYCEFVFNKFM